MIEAATSLRAALDAAAKALEQADIEEPRREARLLFMAALDCSLSHLVLKERDPLGDAAAAVNAMLARRLRREPISRILGQREFRGLDLKLGSETLDPRPDTEVLVEATLEALATIPAPRILDIGTGTGAILLALLSALPGASGIGIDIAPEAARVAQENAARLDLSARAGFLVGDLLAPITPGERFHAIVSNPPYIPSADLAGLDPEVRLYDPLRALDGGADGLDFYRRIARAAKAHLEPGGILAFEVGKGQDEDVHALMAAQNLCAPRTFNDLAGIPRVVLAQARTA